MHGPLGSTAPAAAWLAAGALLCAMVATGPGAALAQTADDVQCRKCVGNSDIAKGAVSRNRIRPGAVSANRLREGAVTPAKWAIRIFDATGRTVGIVSGGEEGGVMIEVAAGPHAGEFFHVSARRNGLAGDRVHYTLDDCKGDPYDLGSRSASSLKIPFEGWTGPDPAFGADIDGVAIRPAFFLPAAPDAVPQTGLTFESRSVYERGTGTHECDSSVSFTDGTGLPLDVILDPDLGSFTPPYRAAAR